MEFNINATDLLTEIYNEVENNYYKGFDSNTNEAVINVAILTLYNEVVNKRNFKNLIFDPKDLENVNTPNVKIAGLSCNELSKPIGRGL